MPGQRQYALEKARRDNMLGNIHVGALVRVSSFDPASMTVDVTPLSKWLDNGVYQSPPPILGVPVAPTRCGGFILRPWYEPGDVGAVLYMDHDLDSALAGGGECEPNTERTHAPDDAVFVGGVVAGGKQMGAIPDGLAIAREDGGLYIVITKEGIKILGNATWEGDIDVTGHVTITGELIVNGIAFSPHTHSGVVSGGDSSGPPQGGA